MTANLAQASVVGNVSEHAAALVEQVRSVCRASPMVRPIAGGRPMRVKVSNAGPLGWVADGTYHYSPTDSHGNPWPPIPQLWLDILDRFAGPHAWDSVVVNWYAANGFGPDGLESANLGWHRDISERDHTKPIVTISLGDACTWSVRRDEDEPVHTTTLDSGDVTLLEGPTRLALHRVGRIIPASMFSPLSHAGRLSLTGRVAS